MFLFRSAKIKKRMEKLWSFCAYHISEYEKQCSQSVPSALPDLKKQVWNMMESFSDEISTWDDNSVDYDTISRTLLSHSAFDLLTSGKYHLSPGMLNPMSCAAKIKTVYEKIWNMPCSLAQSPQKKWKNNSASCKNASKKWADMIGPFFA